MTAVDPAKVAELVRLRDEATTLCAQAARLAEKVAAVLDGEIPDPPVKRRKRHLALVRDAGLT